MIKRTHRGKSGWQATIHMRVQTQRVLTRGRIGHSTGLSQEEIQPHSLLHVVTHSTCPPWTRKGEKGQEVVVSAAPGDSRHQHAVYPVGTEVYVLHSGPVCLSNMRIPDRGFLGTRVHRLHAHLLSLGCEHLPRGSWGR